MPSRKREAPRRYTDFGEMTLLRKTPGELAKKGDWADAVVRSTSELGLAGDRMPAGTFWIVKRNYGGLELRSFPCRCCGKQSFVGRVGEDEVTYIGHLPASDNWLERRKAREAADRMRLNGSACRTPAERYAVELIRTRVQRTTAGASCSEHTIITGTDEDARRRVLEAAAREAAGTGSLVACLEGARTPGTGAAAIWRAAADRTGPPATDEDVAPLGRLMDLENTGASSVTVCIADLDQLVERWKDRHEAWTLRHTLQNEPRVAVVATCGEWPPPGTTATDSGAWSSFAVSDIGPR